MTALVFVDTNILVYSRDARDPRKQQRAHDWLSLLWERKAGRLSGQVLNEYYVTVTQKLKPGLAAAEARDDVRALFHWLTPTHPSAQLDAAWAVQDRYRLSFWDALIVGAAQAADCRYILSEDLSADQDLDGVLVVNPFETEPTQLQ